MFLKLSIIQKLREKEKKKAVISPSDSLMFVITFFLSGYSKFLYIGFLSLSTLRLQKAKVILYSLSQKL